MSMWLKEKSKMWEKSPVLNDSDYVHEPLIHWVMDRLPDGHPLESKVVYCISCAEMLKSSTDEYMIPWIESGKGNYCISCFDKESSESLNEMEFSLRCKKEDFESE